ncbi:MAG: TRAP transporter permease, partial [bacterium]
FIFVYEPVLLLIGEFQYVIVAVISAVLATTLLAASLMGFLYRRIGYAARIAFFISGLILMYPGIKSDITGFLIAVATI